MRSFAHHTSPFTRRDFIRFRREAIEHQFEFPPLALQRLRRSVGGHPDRLTPEEQPSAGRKGKHEAVPGSKDFFFEQPNARGTMGSPVALARWMTPICTICLGPLGPSGVTTKSFPANPNLIIRLSAAVPPLVEDPRTASRPNRATMRRISSPSRCWLIKTWASFPR